MESAVSRLLADFESGKMTRRQLVQSLTLVALGVPVASAVAQAMPTGATGVSTSGSGAFNTVYLDHISYAVADYKKSTEFYTSLMGWKVLEDTGTQASLDINGIGGIIIRNGRRPGAGPGRGGAAGAAGGAAAGAAGAASGARRDSAASGARASRPPLTGVINHISWGIDSWDNERVRDELKRRGLDPRPDSGDEPDMATSAFKSYHVIDPDGWDLQISNQTKEKHKL